VSVLYVSSSGLDLTYYNSTDCANLISQDDPRFYFLEGSTCPDVPNINDFNFGIQGSSNFLGISFAANF